MKVFAIKVSRKGREDITKGTLPELIEYYGYTLECGVSWQHEKGNKKINRNPKGIKSLVTNLNNAKSNSASNGCSDTYYEVAEI